MDQEMPKSPIASVSLILAILSLLSFHFSTLTFILGTASILLAIYSRKEDFHFLATSSIALAFIAIMISSVFLLMSHALVRSHEPVLVQNFSIGSHSADIDFFEEFLRDFLNGDPFANSSNDDLDLLNELFWEHFYGDFPNDEFDDRFEYILDFSIY